MEPRVTRWGTRFGFYLAAVGSAFGLGNLWRFPYVVADNGGGAFVFIYLALVFLIGMPFLIGELMLGKQTGSAVIPAARRMGKEPGAKEAQGRGRYISMRLLSRSGYLAIATCLMILAYYSVISGWVLHFLVRFSISALWAGDFEPNSVLAILLNNGWLQLLLTFVHLLLVMIVVIRGFEAGVESWVSKLMPVFLIMVVGLALRSLSLESSAEALRFFLYPDFSQLTTASLGRAVGQVCFTLSLGFGTMVTFGSYMSERVSVPVAGFRVAIFDSLISLVAGVMIFPLVLQSLGQGVAPTLLFESVPFLFAKEAGGEWVGIIFFFCLYVAALGSSIGLLETAVANARETSKMRRSTATIVSALICLFIAVVPALSTSVLRDQKIAGTPVLEAWDGLLVNWILPIVAVLISQVVLLRIDQSHQKEEFESVPVMAMGRLYAHWRFAIRYLAPALCLLGLILQLL